MNVKTEYETLDAQKSKVMGLFDEALQTLKTMSSSIDNASSHWEGKAYDAIASNYHSLISRIENAKKVMEDEIDKKLTTWSVELAAYEAKAAAESAVIDQG